LPIYEYRCESCDHRMEKLQKMSEGVLVDCPECERPALKRLISASAFRLTGSGWYETDFKKDNKRNLAESSNKDTSGKESSGKESSGKESSGKESSGKESSGKDTSDKKPSGADSKKTDSSSSESTVKKADSNSAAKPAAKSAAKENKHA